MAIRKTILLSLLLSATQAGLLALPAITATATTNTGTVQSNITPLIRFENDPLVNINLSNALVGDVLKALSDQVGYNLIVNTKVTEEVIPRIEFNNMRLSEAMSFILRLKNLTIRRIGRTLFIYDLAQASSSGINDSIIKTYKLGNLTPTEAIAKINQFYTGNTSNPVPKLIPDDPTNTLIVMGRSVEVDFLDSIMAIVDAPVPQVMIEIKLIELSESASRSLGMSYGFGQNQFGASFNNAAPGTTGTTNTVGSTPVVSQGLKLSFDALRNFTANFNAEINALVNNSQARILSNPKIATQNAKPAIFETTETVPVVQTTQTAAGQTQNITTIPIGERINVTPLIIDTQSGFVTLDLRPEISTRGEDVIVNGNPVPETLRRSVQTFMKVRSGESIVIGGLKRKNSTSTSNRLPLLGDIPFIGALFSNNNWSDADTEIIIMVTPYILEDSATPSTAG